MDPFAIATIIGGVAGVAFLGYVVRDIRRELRRRDPLRIDISPHRLDDRVLVTVTNRGDQDLELAWGAVRMSDKSEPLLSTILQSGWDVFGAKVDPVSRDDGYIFPILREWIPPGVTPVGVWIFDKSMHKRYDPIPAELGRRLRRA